MLGSNGEWQVISEVYTVKTPLNSYNLEVNTDHTFFVKGIGGLDGVWVHNKNCIYSVENAKSTEIINGEKVYTVEINGKNKKYISNPNYVEGGTEGPYVEVKTSGRGDKRSYNIVQPNKPVTSVDLDKGVIKAEKGSEGNFNKALFKPEPDKEYNLSNGHTYTTDSEARVVEVRGDLSKIEGDRNQRQQSISGGQDRQNTDHGGHLIATMFNGAGEGINIVPMDGKLNGRGGRWNNWELGLRKALNEGKTVQVEIKIEYANEGKRPTSFNITQTIDGKPTMFTLKNTPTGE